MGPINCYALFKVKASKSVMFYLWVVVGVYGAERGSCMVYGDPKQFYMGNMLVPLCVCYSFNLSPGVFIYEEDKVLSYLVQKYLFLGEFLLLAQQNTKCCDLGMLAGR